MNGITRAFALATLTPVVAGATTGCAFAQERPAPEPAAQPTPVPHPAHPVKVSRDRKAIHVTTPLLQVNWDLTTGRWDCGWRAVSLAAHPSLDGAYCTARLSDGSEIDSTSYSRHDCAGTDVTPLHDLFGNGVQVVVHHWMKDKPEIRQQFQIYESQPFVLTQMEIVSPNPIASNEIAPLVTSAGRSRGSGIHLQTGDKPRTLFVPFDNDAWVRYNSDYASDSYEVSAVYDNASRLGFVIGSVDHDVWKTRITQSGMEPGSVGDLRAYGGGTGTWTHDSQPHGMVSGTSITSPRIFIGCFSDWRDGLENFGRVNARLTPLLPWTGGVPFGWNSWTAFGTHVDDTRCLAVSDFIRDHLQPAGFGSPGAVYVNLDSYWDNIPEDRLRALVRHIHANGQKAGIYWSPFTAWGDNMTRTVEGTGGRYTYGDILLKDASGRPLPKLDGGWPIDPSHPGALQRIDWQMDRFVRWGFDFVKLDFLSHGSLEGAHAAAPTGIAAYNLGMKRIVQDLDPKKIGRPFFISLSIAPLFPSGYGHSRRISCDAAGSIKDSEYVLNSLTYGWWINDTLYRFNDPDMIALSASDAEARTRVNSVVIAGTVLLDSDDLGNPAIQRRAETFLTNPAILAIAREGRAFRPLEGDTGAHAADVFVRQDTGGRFLIAVFNFGNNTVSRNIDLARAGLRSDIGYKTRDLWTGREGVASLVLTLDLGPRESEIVELTAS